MSSELDLIIPPGRQQFATAIPLNGSNEPFAWNLGTVTQNAAYAGSRFRVAREIVVSKIGYYVGATSAGNVNVGILTANAAETSFAHAAISGSTAAGATNAIHQVSLATPLLLVPGVDYWPEFAADDATMTVARITNNLTNLVADSNHTFLKAASFAMDTALVSVSKTSTLIAFYLYV